MLLSQSWRMWGCRLIILISAIFCFDGQWVKTCSSEKATYTVNFIRVSVCAVTEVKCHHWEASLAGEFSYTHEFGLHLVKKHPGPGMRKCSNLPKAKLTQGIFVGVDSLSKEIAVENHGKLLSWFYC